MTRVEQFGVFVFHSEAPNGASLKCADGNGKCATFRNSAQALKEMSDRGIYYGTRTEIVDLVSGAVVLETIDRGTIWSVPAEGRRSAALPPA